MLVVAVPVHVGIWHCSRWQVVAGPPGQTPGWPPEPQAMPSGQVPQSSVPPQPVPITPQ